VTPTLVAVIETADNDDDPAEGLGHVLRVQGSEGGDRPNNPVHERYRVPCLLTEVTSTGTYSPVQSDTS